MVAVFFFLSRLRLKSIFTNLHGVSSFFAHSFSFFNTCIHSSESEQSLNCFLLDCKEILHLHPRRGCDQSPQFPYLLDIFLKKLKKANWDCAASHFHCITNTMKKHKLPGGVVLFYWLPLGRGPQSPTKKKKTLQLENKVQIPISRRLNKYIWHLYGFINILSNGKRLNRGVQ